MKDTRNAAKLGTNFNANIPSDLIGSKETNAIDILGKLIGIFGNGLNGIITIMLKDLDCIGGG